MTPNERQQIGQGLRTAYLEMLKLTGETYLVDEKEFNAVKSTVAAQKKITIKFPEKIDGLKLGDVITHKTTGRQYRIIATPLSETKSDVFTYFGAPVEEVDLAKEKSADASGRK